MKEKDLLEFLERANEKRLTEVELESFLDECGNEEFSLNFRFISRSRSFGNQKDSRYNEGNTVICNVDGLDVECSLLFTVEDEEHAESLESGNVFTSKAHVLDYDSLYRRIVFGNNGPIENSDSFHANELKSDERTAPENSADHVDLVKESQEQAPRENLKKFPDPPLPPEKPLVPRGAGTVILNENERVADLQIEKDVDSEIVNDSHGDVVDESVESQAVHSDEPLISTQSWGALDILKEKLPTRKDIGAKCLSVGAGCLSGCFITIGIAVTLVGCVAGGEVGLIGLVLIGIGVPLYYYADPKGNDFSLKKGLAKESGDNNSKSNKESHWPVLISLYVTGAFLLFSGAMNGNWILILIGLIVIVSSIAYQKAIHDRNKGSS